MKQLWRSGGAGAVLTWLLGMSVYRRAHLFACDLDVVEEHSTDVPLTLARMSEDDIPAYMALLPRRSEEAISRRFAVGDIGYGGWLGNRLVTVHWARPRRAGVREFGLTLELGPKDVYTFSSYTAPELRGRNVATARSSRMLIALREMGYRRGFSYVVPENRAALGPPLKIGYRHVGWIGFVGFPPLRVGFVKEHGERLQLRFRGSRPITLGARNRASAVAAGLLGGCALVELRWTGLLDTARLLG
jgi:GNAT superfamily N-acetyltransferase